MTVIDSDAHVIETEKTWNYMTGDDERYRPQTVPVPGPRGQTEMWLMEGRLVSKGPAGVGDTERRWREMDDIDGRLAHMDKLGTDIHVLYPTVFLRPVTTRPEAEVALYRAYNRWLADIWAKGKNRLRWAVMLPWSNMDAAHEELRFAKENGACAIFMRGIEGERLPSDPYYFSIYQEAADLDIPVCVHAATGNFAIHDLFSEDTGFWRFKLPGVTAFHNVIMKGIPARFPKLRFGFVELSSQWVPYAIHDMTRRMERQGKQASKANLLRENRIWVACQTDDDIPYVLKYAGEGNLVMGTDYGHADTSSELEALKHLREIDGVSAGAAAKILGDNAKALYSL
jgi:predicted TIM-barrel fold metal-dependent hydrolase